MQEHVDPAGRGGAAAAGLDPGQGEVPVGQPRVAGHQWRPDPDREMLRLYYHNMTRYPHYIILLNVR